MQDTGLVEIADETSTVLLGRCANHGAVAGGGSGHTVLWVCADTLLIL